MQKRMQDTEKRFAEGETKSALATWKFVYDEFKQVDDFKEFAEYARQRFGLIAAEIPASNIPVRAVDEGSSADSSNLPAETTE